MGETRFIVAGNFIDGSGADLRRNVLLSVRDGIISAIGPVADLPRQTEVRIDDFSRCTIVPPLVDCSVFLSKSPSVDSSHQAAGEEAEQARKTVVVAQHISFCHAHGVLGVVDNGDPGKRHQESSPAVPPGGIISLRTAGRLSRNREDCQADGDFLKIGYTNDIAEETSRAAQLTPADLGRILQGRGEKKAVVVANGRQQVAEALAAGCDAIEQGYGMGEDNLREMARRKVLWIPSVLRAKNGLDGVSGGGAVCCRFSQRYLAPGKPLPGAEAFWKKTLAGQLAQLRLARELGVPTAVGTGAGTVGILHGEGMVEEMKLFLKAGYTLAETICCASTNGAEFFAMENLGPLSVGRKATFLITRGTVHQLPRKLSYLEGIYIDGAPCRAYHKNPTGASPP